MSAGTDVCVFMTRADEIRVYHGPSEAILFIHESEGGYPELSPAVCSWLGLYGGESVNLNIHSSV